MATAFSIEGNLFVPPVSGAVAAPLPFGLAGTFDSKVEIDLELPALAGSKSVDFGTLPVAGAKALLVSHEYVQGADPVLLTLNAADTPIELSTGGFLLLGSPVPVDGLISLSIAHTAAARVRVRLLG